MVKAIQNKNIPTQTIKSASYSDFLGVDFKNEQTVVSNRRSPDSLNMLFADGGLKKRRGWRVLHSFTGGAVNGIFKYADNNYLVHCGTGLYKWDGVTATAITGIGGTQLALVDHKSSSFSFGGNLYLLTGREYICYDGSFAFEVGDNAYIPYTTIGGKDAVTSEAVGEQPCFAGKSLQSANKLTAKRKNTFITKVWTNATGTFGDNLLYLDGVAASIDSVMINGTEYASSKYLLTHYYITAQGEIAETADISVADFSGLKSNINNIVLNYFPTTNGAPACEVCFSAYGGNTAADISGCTVASIYANRVFAAGNPAKPNTDFACELLNPAYFPDTGYTVIGNENSAIMGYLRMGDYQAIIKEDNAQDATVFLRSYTLTEAAGDAVFPVKQGIAGNGAISYFCFGNLVDDPLFLSRNGVYALATQNVTSERIMAARSSFIDHRLTAEKELRKAVACEWNGYWLIFINGHVYAADSRQKSYANNTTQSFEYEWYLWDNVPAVAVLEDNGTLYFGTASGELCRFNNDLLTSSGEEMMSTYADAYKMGEAVKERCAINAYWATPKADDGSFMTYKTMPKKGCGLYLKTYTRSSVDIFIVTDRDSRLQNKIKTVNTGIFNFADLDFEHFTFNTLPQAVIPFNYKVKKYKTVQIYLRNNVIDEGFGVLGIERKFTAGNYVK